MTTNKGPVALFYPELSAAAAERVTFGVEGTVMGGTPLLRVGRELLAAAGVSRIQESQRHDQLHPDPHGRR